MISDPTGPAPPGVPVADDPFAAGEAGGRVIRGGTLRVAGSLAGVLAGVVSAPLVVRHLGVADYGRYLTVTSVIFVVTALTEGGLANVAVRLFTVGDGARRRSLIANLTGLRLVLGAFGAAAAVAFGAIAGYEEVLVVGLALGSAGYLLSAIQGSYSVALSGTLRLGALAGLDVLRSLMTTGLLIALVIANSGLTGFYLVASVVQGFALIVTAALVRREVPLGPAFDRASWRELLRETAVYALAATLGAIYFQVALISMSLLDSGTQTGYYAIAFRIVEILNGIPWLLAGSVLPVLAVAARADHARLRFVAGRVFEGAVIAGGWVALIIILGARFGIDIIAGAKGQPSIAVLRIMGIGVTATYLVASWGFVLLSLGMFRQLVIANAGALLLAALLSVLLIPTLHARGGAITTVAVEFWLAGSYIFFLSRRDIRPPTPFVVRFAVAVGLALAAGALVLSASSPGAVLAASVVYFAALWRMRAIPSELLDALPWRG
ncbi:MAG TPA: oligosaccharide flippase family protein [Solirubrobacteraceae bacterium]|nr:oligosaccharide flippase family protein [Solirubrobacteraceae bacterium]